MFHIEKMMLNGIQVLGNAMGIEMKTMKFGKMKKILLISVMNLRMSQSLQISRQRFVSCHKFPMTPVENLWTS